MKSDFSFITLLLFVAVWFFRCWIMVPRFLRSSVFVKVTLVMWLLSTVFIMILLNKIDGIVHGELYNYGLQFSYNWATPYWAFLRLVYLCLILPTILSTIVFALDLFVKAKIERPVPKTEVKPSSGRVQAQKQNNMLINCPNCRKMFSKPLTMLDFGSGKAQLVSVCPYCSHILGRADEEKPSSVQVLEPEKKEVP